MRDMEIVPTWPNELASAARLLGRAAHYADLLHRSPWQFAVELREINAVGLSVIDLRYLVSLGLLEHADEVPSQPSEGRLFESSVRLSFSARTCFILSATGRTAVSHLVYRHVSSSHSVDHDHTTHLANAGTCHTTPTPPQRLVCELKPTWNQDRCQLIFNGHLVKEYHAPAKNQYLVLSAFQEEDWPVRIDDPLPPVAGLDSKRRLHLTIAALNRFQKNAIIHFGGDGTGCGVRWSALL